jgi:hypothetical protein
MSVLRTFPEGYTYRKSEVTWIRVSNSGSVTVRGKCFLGTHKAMDDIHSLSVKL